MAQHIGVIKIDENGETVKDPQINFAELSDALSQLTNYENKYPWLSSIDPYGDTYFNLLQSKKVMSELKNTKSEPELAGFIKNIDDLITFFESLDTHEYVKFIGD